MAEFAQLDVKEIQCNVPRSHFSNEEIERMADLILAGNGVIRPLIVKIIDVENYLLVEGELLYHASARAREKDPRRGEMVNVFIIPDEQDEIVSEQLALLNRANDGENQVVPTGTPSLDSNELSKFLTNFVISSESRINEISEKMLQAEHKLSSRVQRLEEAVTKEKQRDLLDLINTSEEERLSGLLSMYGADKSKIEAICKARYQKENKKFDSYQELQNVKGLGAKGLLVLIDRARMYNQ